MFPKTTQGGSFGFLRQLGRSRGPCMYRVYTSGPDRLPYDYFGAQYLFCSYAHDYRLSSLMGGSMGD